jgi:hypothetical protein
MNVAALRKMCLVIDRQKVGVIVSDFLSSDEDAMTRKLTSLSRCYTKQIEKA